MCLLNKLIKRRRGKISKFGNDRERNCEKYEGVPLVVSTLGSLLFSKLDIDELEFVRNNEIWN